MKEFGRRIATLLRKWPYHNFSSRYFD